MAKSLVDTIRQMITPSVTSQLSGAYRESTPAVEKGLGGAAIALLGLIAARSDDHGFMNQVFSLVKEPTVVDAIESTERALQQAQRATSEPAGVLGRFRSLALGNKGSVVDALARYGGVNTSTASSLLAVASAFILGQLSRLVRQDQLDASSLARRFATERPSINAALPAALASVIAVGRPSAANRRTDRVDRPVVTSTPQPHGWSPMAWAAVALVGAVALAALFAVLRGNRDTQLTSIAPPTGVGTSGYVTRTLPGRTDLRFPASGMEGQLLTYIETASPSGRETWFEFDRLNFETDSATLRADSREQLSNTAVILRAYPRVRVKIGGYTDNSGDPATNLRLSQARASAVAAELRSLGIAGDRLVAEGYGDQYPIADNSTAEGRARNRRVAIRVINK